MDRIAAIAALPEASGREALAGHLARNSAMTVDQVAAALRTAPRETDTAAAAAAASATTARMLLGLSPDVQADQEIGRRAAAFEANRRAESERVEADRAKFEKEFAGGRAAAEALLGRRH